MTKTIVIIVAEFIERNKDYKNDIDNFINYLETQEKGASFYNRYTLGGMSTKGILESLDYYVSIGQFKKKETARKYLSAVGQLFEYIFENTNIENTDLRNQLGAPVNRIESYARQCNEYVNNNDLLAEKERNRALVDGEARQLIEKCNRYIDDAFSLDDSRNSVVIKKMIVSMSIKLILLMGVAYRQIRLLRFCDIEFMGGVICLNGYKIRLPLRYNKQLHEYKDKLEAFGFNVDNGYLFPTLEGEQWGEKTSSSGIPDFLRSNSSESSITSLVKYGVTKLLLAGVSDNIIIKITGVSRDILDDCIKPEEEDTYCYINEKM